MVNAAVFVAGGQPNRSSQVRNTTAIPPAPTCASSRAGYRAAVAVAIVNLSQAMLGDWDTVGAEL
jgi:hypothetical protein